ncbi:hypothetical protein GUJ93_ZPchr0009g620 [Zizania palustris]|uniref:Uncharacterized protein n=1 Tax=Zizania palustris TaxID=103762 RepID=A0A8J5V347_ZIZPA|nr:hypothetical protein GUJ93_ZPchr0009g620 [Zizania palustris]
MGSRRAARGSREKRRFFWRTRDAEAAMCQIYEPRLTEEEAERSGGIIALSFGDLSTSSAAAAGGGWSIDRRRPIARQIKGKFRFKKIFQEVLTTLLDVKPSIGRGGATPFQNPHSMVNGIDYHLIHLYTTTRGGGCQQVHVSRQIIAYKLKEKS